MREVSERHAQTAILAHLPDLAPEVSDEEVLLSQVGRVGTSRGEFMKAVSSARSSCRLEDPVNDYIRLLQTDMVIRARSGDQTFMVAVEVSTTVDNADVRRAVKSANLLNRVFGVTDVVPLVAGSSIRPYTLLYAEREGVVYIRVEPEETDPDETEEVIKSQRETRRRLAVRSIRTHSTRATSGTCWTDE